MFERYNNAVRPAQLILFVVGILAIWLAIQRKADLSKTVSLVLAMFWIWMGLVYHFWFFTSINSTAVVFALFFALQGTPFVIAGVWKQQLSFRFALTLHGIVGGALLLYAIVVYPALGYWLGHRYPAAPTFGLTLPDNDFHFRPVALDRPQSSSLHLSHTAGLVFYWLLGSDFSANDLKVN